MSVLTEGNMDLEEYLFYRKRKDSSFQEQHFAKQLGITQHQLWKIKTGKIPPSSKMILLIQKHTNGEVDVMEMIRAFYKDKL